MSPHEQLYLDSMLNLATERLVERAVHRAGSAAAARAAMTRDADAAPILLSSFVDRFFADAMLDNTAGACAVLQALADQPMPPASTLAGSGEIGDGLRLLARATFASALAVKAEEALDRAASFEAEPVQ